MCLFRCNIFIGFRIIKEMPGLVSSGTSCIKPCTFTKTLVSDSAFLLCLPQLRSLPRVQHSLRLLWLRGSSVRTFPILLIFLSKCSMEYSCIYFLLYDGSYIHTSLQEISSFPDDEEREMVLELSIYSAFNHSTRLLVRNILLKGTLFHTDYKSNKIATPTFSPQCQRSAHKV